VLALAGVDILGAAGCDGLLDLLGATLLFGATLLLGAENPGIEGLDGEDADILGAAKVLMLELICGLANTFCLLDRSGVYALCAPDVEDLI